MSNYFEELNDVDVSNHQEKKGQFTYLSWPFAVAELLKRHPEATWEVHTTSDGEGEVQPYMSTEQGFFVQVTVRVPVYDGNDIVRWIPRTQVHPVLDNRNKALTNPTSFQINTSIQRCLVKAIALHGLGLYIYAGEDLPDGATPEPNKEVVDRLSLAASHGTTTFREEWKKINPSDRMYISSGLINEWKAQAVLVDASNPTEEPND
jgi:hypothetical protein